MNNTGLTNARAAIRETLRTTKVPLSAQKVADYSGVPIETTRQILSRMVERSEAHNLGSSRVGSYLSGAAPVPQMPQEFRRHSGEHYTGQKPIPMREGAMDAYALPSIQGGKLVERRRPMLIACKPEQRL